MAKAPQSTILANFEQAAKRLYAGAASPFADLFDPDAFKDVKGLPNLNAAKKPVAGVEQVPAAAYLISKLVNPNINVPYLERAADRMLKNDQFMREHIGIGDPKNFADVALETVGSLLVPGPKGAAVVRMRPTTGLSVAEKVATGTRKVATGTAKTVAESVIPFRQGTSIAKAAAVQVPLAVGISEGLDAALQSPDYNSVADMVDGPVSAMDQPLETFIPEELKTIYQEAGVAQDDQTQADILDIAAQEQEKEAAKEYFPEDPAWKDPVTTAAIFGALGIGAFGARNVARRLAGANLNPVDKLTGRGGVNDITPKGVKLQQANVQHDASLRWAGELLYGKGSEDHAKFLAKLDSVTSAPLATKTQHAMTTGEMPNSAIARRPLRVTLEAFSSDLDDAEWQIVSDGLLARNALDDLNRTETQAAFNTKRDGTPMTPADLQQMVDNLNNDPKLSGYSQLIKQHYRDLLDYALEQGLITPRAHGELIQARPNFVHMSRNLAPDDSNSLFFSRGATSGQTANERNRIFSRSTEEFGGVQVGATADPIAELPGQFNKIISQAEINRVKRDFFENAVNNAELSTVIKQLPIGETPKSKVGEDGIHEVLVNGIKVYYKVEDSAINAALDFSPVAAKTAVSTILGVPKKIAQTFYTGAGNPLFASTSALYDTITGMALRPRGYDLGLLNEFKNKLLSQSALNNPVVKESSEWISRLDPTVWVSAPIGALRLGYDELVGAMAHDLQARLLKSNDWFVNLIGGRQKVQVLERRLASAYNSSIKSLMDKTGATTSNQLNPQDVATQARGTVDVAPRFFARANERAYNEALEGNASFAEATLLGSKNLFDQVRAAPLSRGYLNLVRLLHEGFRYQAFASNIGKTQTRVGPYVINDTELQQLLASQTRRISADIGQTGAAQVYQEAARSAMYMNVGVQTLAEVGRKFARQPLTTTINLVTALTMMMGMQYLYAASDPERAKEIANLTDDEQTRTVKTPLGDIPVPPELRLIWGPLTAITNEVTGINYGQMDPNFISVFEQWIDNDFDLGEAGQFSLAESAKSAIRDVMPVGIGSSPVVNALAATQGIDLAMTRFSGKPTEIQGQQISQLGGEGRLTDDAISATSQKIIQELLGITSSDFIRSGLDADRALSGGGTLSDAARVALSRMQDNAVKQAGPLRKAFFGDYERVKNINDTEFNLWYEKKQGLDKATQTLRQDVLQQFVTGADPRFALLRNTDTIEPRYANTALAPIGAVAADLTKALRPLQLRMNELKDQTDFTKNQKLSGIEDRNIQINDYNEERQAIAQQMLYYTQMAEDNIRQMLGDPSFSFQNFDPKTYASMPWPPLPPEPVAQPSVGQGPQ